LTGAAVAAAVVAARAIPDPGNGDRITAEATVPLCIWAAIRSAPDFVEAMWATVSAPGDRGTTCAIVGGIAALNRFMIEFPDRMPATL